MLGLFGLAIYNCSGDDSDKAERNDVVASAEYAGDYTEAETAMLKATHTEESPWTVVHANDQKRARLEVMRVILTAMDYDGKDAKAIGKVDGKIAGPPNKILKGR